MIMITAIGWVGLAFRARTGGSCSRARAVIFHMSSPLPHDAGVHRRPPILIGITVGITPPAGLQIGLASWIRTPDLADTRRAR